MTDLTAVSPTGFFVQLMPILTDRALMLIVSKIDDQHLTLSVVPKRDERRREPRLAYPALLQRYTRRAGSRGSQNG